MAALARKAGGQSVVGGVEADIFCGLAADVVITGPQVDWLQHHPYFHIDACKFCANFDSAYQMEADFSKCSKRIHRKKLRKPQKSEAAAHGNPIFCLSYSYKDQEWIMI